MALYHELIRSGVCIWPTLARMGECNRFVGQGLALANQRPRCNHQVPSSATAFRGPLRLRTRRHAQQPRGKPVVMQLNNLIEHIKQHLVLWYLNRMNGYVQKSLGDKLPDYDLHDDPKIIDKLFGAASQHVDMDANATLKGIMPVIQQLVAGLKQFQPQPQLTPDAKVLLDTSMAETKRRQARDQAELQLKDKELAAKIQMDMAELQQRQQPHHQGDAPHAQCGTEQQAFSGRHLHAASP
mgnify:CR=1 FL=1